MQPALSLTANYNRTVESFRDSIAMNGFRLVASMDPHIRQFLNVMAQEPLAAIPVTRSRGSSLCGARAKGDGILCMTRDFFVYAQGRRVFRFNNDSELFDRNQPQSIGSLGADGCGLALRQKGYSPAYSNFYGSKGDVQRFVEAAARL